jgi:hypothetical protein
MAFSNTTATTVTNTNKKQQLPSRTLLRRAGLGVATAMLALGLFAGPRGASAAPLAPAPEPAVQAGVTTAAYYNPTVTVPRYVASGDAIAVAGTAFAAYDAVSIALVDGYNDIVSSGTAYTDEYGDFSGALDVPYLEPGAYTLIAVDGYGTVIPVGFWITYPY